MSSTSSSSAPSTRRWSARGVISIAALAPVVVLAGCTPSTPDPAVSPATTSAAAPATAPPESEDDRAAILRAGRERNRAMLDGDLARLDALLADDFTAIHITGYGQPKAEWLEQVASGEMAYHDVEEVSADVEVDGDTAVLTTRNRMTATINGADGTWPLESVTGYERRGGVWVATTSRSSTY